MRRTLITIAIASAMALTAGAQTLNVVVGDVTYALPAAEAGDMAYTSGLQLTIMGRTLNTADITRMYVDNSKVEYGTVSVSYNGTTAKVVVAGNVAQYVTPTVSGAHVTIEQAESVGDDTCGEITYTLNGSSADGSFTLSGSYKASIELQGLTLTSTLGAPLDIQDGKRISLSVKKGTVNTLADSADGSQKGCLACKGHLELKGKGTLNVYGNTAHGIYAKEYVELKNCTVNVLSAVKDGMNCNQYFLMDSGELNISGVGDDGVQVSYKEDNEADRDAEDTGSITINGGTINISATADDVKGLKAIGDITINDGSITASTPGSESEAIESKAVMTINGGTIVANAGDDALNSGSHMYIKGGTITAVSTGNDGLDSNGNMYIQGGTIMAFGTREPECGIDANEEEGYSVIFTGGTLLAVGGGNSVPSTAESTQPYVSASASVTADTEITLKSGDNVLATFTVPSNYTSQNGGQGGGPGGWNAPGQGGGPGGHGGGSGNSSVLITCPGLTSGSTYTITSGSASTSATAALKGSSTGGGGRPW